MRCQSCGKEIADKTIICYRCGAPTASPERRERQPSPVGGAGGELVAAVLVVVLAIAGAGGLYWQEAPLWSYGVAGGVAGAAFVWLRLRRRSGPSE